MNEAAYVYCGIVVGNILGMFHMAYQMSFNGSRNVEWAGPLIFLFVIAGGVVGMALFAIKRTAKR